MTRSIKIHLGGANQKCSLSFSSRREEVAVLACFVVDHPSDSDREEAGCPSTP
jgi:hypothetical protein